MSNFLPAEERHARLYLHLAERFGWTPEQVNAIDPSLRQVMAKVLNLSPCDEKAFVENDKQPADDVPTEPEGLAEWERELLDRQENDAPLSARDGDIVINLHLDGKQIYQAIVPYAERDRMMRGRRLGDYT